jgi:excisionase family DNA binding protein
MLEYELALKLGEVVKMAIISGDPIGFEEGSSKHRNFRSSHVEVKDVANYCMVSTTTVRRWLKNGDLHAIKLPSNQYRISVGDFKDFLRRYKIPIKEEFFSLS